jgi:O-acetyl-ADP-ribose deacetylase
MIKIIQVDITTLDVDAIVNAANESLLGGGGVDGAIHRTAGPQLLDFNRGLNGCLTGQAKLSPGFKLPARWVISTVGPVWQGGKHGEAELLESCYRCCFQLALENDIRSLAFPAISTGVYAYPKPAAAKIALAVMKEHEAQLESILACCFSSVDIKLYQDVLAGLFD